MVMQIKRNTVFQVEEDYDVSFTTFFESLFLLPFADKIVEQLKECFGVEVPEQLREKTDRVFTKSWQFLLKRGFDKKSELEAWKINDLRGLIEKNEKEFLIQLNNVIEDVEKIHRNVWNKLSKERKDFIKLLEKIIEKYGDLIIKGIEEKTKIPWQIDKIKVYPVFDVKHRELGNALLLSFTTKGLTEENRVLGLIHEAVHTNTYPVWKKYREASSRNSGDAYEIAVHIIASLVIKDINKKFNQNFTTAIELFDKKIQDEIEKIERFCKETSGFEEFLFKVKNLLNEIGYKSFFGVGSLDEYGKMFEK